MTVLFVEISLSSLGIGVAPAPQQELWREPRSYSLGECLQDWCFLFPKILELVTSKAL